MQWEYQTLSIKAGGFMGGKLDDEAFTRALNELGRERWELVAAFDTAMGSGQTRDVVAVFKRPR
ncbi:MAG: DUF4177 domain-containing protein [Gemmatimonadota bacterium]|nr:MAG: DUF4177 domain-containing protein [Gemmatimonadota bacterium]